MATVGDRARRLYRDVDGEARFRLAAELYARGREAEAVDVVFSARRVDVSRLDPEMSEAFEDLRSLMREFDASSRWAVGGLQVLQVLDVLFRSVDERAGVGDLPVFSVSDVLDVLAQVSAVLETRVAALVRALVELGRERLGLEPDTLLGLQPSWVRAGLEYHRGAIEAADPAATDLEAARRTLLTGWGPEGMGAELRPGGE